jgi:hypothetical protein
MTKKDRCKQSQTIQTGTTINVLIVVAVAVRQLKPMRR